MASRVLSSPQRRFSYFPLPFALFLPILVPVFFLIVLVMGRMKNPWGFPSLLLYALLAVGAVVSWLLGSSYWRRPWRYEIHESGLVADRLWGRHRIHLPWGKIIRVSKVTGKDWRRNWPETVVESRDGIRIVIPSNLGGYKDLIETVRDRATSCREFDAHPTWRFGTRS
jgi:hypothetical protein